MNPTKGMTPDERDDLAKRVADNTYYLGRRVKLTSWADAAAVLETLESLGYEIRKGDPLVETASQGFEAQIIRVEGERDARPTFHEARARMLDAIQGARQAHVKPGAINGDLFGNLQDPDHAKAAEAEQRTINGVQVLDLGDFNAALDTAFPESP